MGSLRSQACGVMAGGVMIQLLVKGQSLLPHCAHAKYGALYHSREKEKRLEAVECRAHV